MAGAWLGGEVVHGQGHLCGDSWLCWAASGCSGTRLLCLETQRGLIPGESPSMDLGINSLILLSCKVSFTTGSCWTGWDRGVITSTDSTTQALSGGVLDMASLQSSM